MEKMFEGLGLEDDINDVLVAEKKQPVEIPPEQTIEETVAACGTNAFDLPESAKDPEGIDVNKKGLRELVMLALRRRGGVDYLQAIPDKEFIKLLGSVIPAELKVTAEIKPHEDFLKLLAKHPKVTDINPEDIKILTG
jgi:hypothetical protein